MYPKALINHPNKWGKASTGFYFRKSVDMVFVQYFIKIA